MSKERSAGSSWGLASNACLPWRLHITELAGLLTKQTRGTCHDPTTVTYRQRNRGACLCRNRLACVQPGSSKVGCDREDMRLKSCTSLSAWKCQAKGRSWQDLLLNDVVDRRCVPQRRMPPSAINRSSSQMFAAPWNRSPFSALNRPLNDSIIVFPFAPFSRNSRFHARPWSGADRTRARSQPRHDPLSTPREPLGTGTGASTASLCLPFVDHLSVEVILPDSLPRT